MIPGQPARRAGFSLVELLVALTVFAVGVLGLAGAATFAQRSFATAAAVERAARIAAAVLDSLVHDPGATSGEHAMSGALARWTVIEDSLTRTIIMEVEARHGADTHRVEFRAAQPRAD
jgi:prepilin-type N-terminal cleavage/methylation domain-containing protein